MPLIPRYSEGQKRLQLTKGVHKGCFGGGLFVLHFNDPGRTARNHCTGGNVLHNHCTGGNHCCCLKVIAAVDSAFTAAELAVSGAAVKAPHGILDVSPEKTMQNLGLIADPGMAETERVILEIMQSKGEKHNV